MTTRGKILTAGLCAFLLGAAPPALMIWNPGHWEWSHHLLGRHGMETANPAVATT